MPSLSSRRHPLTLPADTLIEDFGVAGLGCGSRPYLLGVLFHPRAAEPRSVRWLLVHAHGSLKRFELQVQKGVLIWLT
jgi:hypothetical protein